MGEEIEGAAEKFERAVQWLRQELWAVAAAVAPGVEPRAEERTDDRRTVSGAMGKRFSMALILPDTPYATAAAADAFAEAGWRAETEQGFGGRRLPVVTRDGCRAGGSHAGRALRLWGEVPVVWIHARWIRPPRVATPETLRPGYRLCVMCEGWGTCRICEGLGFVNSRRCPECGLGMDCPDCQGTGQERVRGAGNGC
ncbi:hypothetical protein [Streptomyces sp. NBC_01320]|uniref:hypothetical protein n=1 Tax=Streptomyces sp. NBC_01320 TaxID=2903824 RepID=UPI002E0D1F70|nr:hypothetical protein OG395_01570 [Streptomyces sp. NBC_01320]WSK00985.1 hypothetical protein OG395_53780 [Streptomyces sp. NBC_01320]